jgi:hypothetical protein
VQFLQELRNLQVPRALYVFTWIFILSFNADANPLVCILGKAMARRNLGRRVFTQTDQASS